MVACVKTTLMGPVHIRICTCQISSFSVAPYNITIMGDNLYSQGEQMQLNCLSEGGPVLEYIWLLSGDIIPNANTSTLTIDNVNTPYAGDYTCNVTNNAGYQSNTVTVYSKLCTV